MAKEVQLKDKDRKVKEGMKNGLAYNIDHKVEWLYWQPKTKDDAAKHKAGETSVMNHVLAEKMAKLGRVKIVEENIPRETLKPIDELRKEAKKQ